jgi:CBS domain-containing protein
MPTSVSPPRGSDRTPSLEHATVADVMHPGVFTCPPDTELRDVARLMATHHIHSVVVLGIERTWAGERLTWGILSDIDLVAAAHDPSADAGGAAATELVLVGPDEPLARAVELMAEHRLSHLLVVDAETGRPKGVVSSLDVAGCLAWGEA